MSAGKVKLTCIYECKEVPKKFIRNVLKTILTERRSRYLYFFFFGRSVSEFEQFKF